VTVHLTEPIRITVPAHRFDAGEVTRMSTRWEGSAPEPDSIATPQDSGEPHLPPLAWSCRNSANIVTMHPRLKIMPPRSAPGSSTPISPGSRPAATGSAGPTGSPTRTTAAASTARGGPRACPARITNYGDNAIQKVAPPVAVGGCRSQGNKCIVPVIRWNYGDSAPNGHRRVAGTGDRLLHRRYNSGFPSCPASPNVAGTRPMADPHP